MRKYEISGEMPRPTILLEITIQMERKELRPDEEQWLHFGLAGFLNIPPSSIAILKKEPANSVRVSMILPEEAGRALLRAFVERDPLLAKFLGPMTVSQIDVPANAEGPSVRSTLAKVHARSRPMNSRTSSSNQPATASEPSASVHQSSITLAPELWKDNIWDRLLDSLDERCVIPIVGPDLLHVEIDGTTTLLDQYVARRLALAYELPADDLPAERTLNYVVCQLIRRRKDRNGICDDIFQIMKEANFEPSKPLRQLAEISDFNLFVSTTFDSLLEKAINQVRFGGSPGTSSISYSPKRVDDLPSSKEKLTRPTVYYLMGKLSATGNYVISDEDLLEYVCDLQSPARRPERLLDELKKNHLLILGEDYSDWLFRIFLRTAKGGRLSATSDLVEIMADRKTHGDSSLVSFLVHFSSHTRVFRAGGAVEFVDELWKRWRERHPQSPAPAENLPRRDLPGNAIFISYARDDLPAVQELKAGLEAAGLTVWFDQESLKPGDNFNPRIEQYISTGCSCFVAVISQNTERRLEGFFRREWNLALERDRGIHFERKFILPVVVDDTDSPSAVPPRFAQLNYTWLRGGKVTPVFVQELAKIVSGS